MSEQSTNPPVETAAVNAEVDPLAQFTEEAAAVDTAAKVTPQATLENASEAGSAASAEPETLEPAMTPEDEAGAIVSILTSGITALYPVLDYQESVKKEAAQKLAPLIKKYGVGGSLLAKWEAEIEAGLFFGAMAYQSILQVRADKAEQLKAQAKPSRFANFAKWFKRK